MSGYAHTPGARGPERNTASTCRLGCDGMRGRDNGRGRGVTPATNEVSIALTAAIRASPKPAAKVPTATTTTAAGRSPSGNWAVRSAAIAAIDETAARITNATIDLGVPV